ncbi:hypothetical protein ACLB2K_001818 [Fragaria x ananassa]
MTKLTSCFAIVVFISLHILYQSSASGDQNSTSTYNVLKFGAKRNGVTDSTQAFLETWSAACGTSSDSSEIYVPKGRYLLGAMAFKGDCNSHVTFRIDGTLVASPDYRVLGQANNWFSFERVSGVTIIGGALDAKGSALWACKLSTKTTSCPNGATTLSFTNSKDIRVEGLMSLNSQMFHIVINGCQDVLIQGVKVIAAGNSPNTDGIHVQFSKNVAIFDTSIKTGDDCVSIGPGTKDLWMERIFCGPGHGISIGSLAKDLVEEGVQNVTLKNAIFKGTQNGLRIKSWARPSTGFVQGVQFLDVKMINVQNPIIIDQNYCPHNLNCPGQVSGVKVSDVLYQNIRGTSATAVAIKLDCSAANPCSGVRLENVNLTCRKQAIQSYCTNVNGKSVGTVQTSSCL